MLTNDDIVAKWLQAFAADVPQEIMKNHVTKSGNFMWHIFGFGKTSYLEGAAARKTLDSLSSDYKCILFHSGYSVHDKNMIEDISLCSKPSSSQIEKLHKRTDFEKKDIYLVEQDFQWTYVTTHESGCGPYFCFSG